jgi:hypothetical protein
VNIKWSSARSLPVWLALAALVGAAYLLVGAVGYGVTGFPLDDAWIHQTYARNLATTGQWAFVPGQVSAGSTAPLWSLLLSVGYRLGIPYTVWAYGLGVVALGLTGWTVSWLGAMLYPDQRRASCLAGILCIGEWHLVWAAVSGMETVLFIWLSVMTVGLWQLSNIKYQIPNSKWQVPNARKKGDTEQAWRFQVPDLKFDNLNLIFLLLGFLGGLLALTRPEGLLLVALIGLATGWQRRHAPRRWLLSWAAMGLGLMLTLAPYLIFHYSTTGQPFPNTLYAKQQEYHDMLALYPVWRRWLTVASVTLVGGQVLLLPGFILAVGRAISGHSSSPARGGILLITAWCFAHLALYALRLPVTYQHGRYQMPVIPFLILIGTAGTGQLLRLVTQPSVNRILARTMIASLGLVFLAFVGIGARAYATDVGFIQGEMVATARWLVKNTPEHSRIAVHDIGAVGYFANRPLLDLAGLITPQVIPFITNESLLTEFIQSEGADYVIFFPDWSAPYQRMAADSRLELVHTTGFQWTLDQGRANMAVYRVDARIP